MSGPFSFLHCRASQYRTQKVFNYPGSCGTSRCTTIGRRKTIKLINIAQWSVTRDLHRRQLLRVEIFSKYCLSDCAGGSCVRRCNQGLCSQHIVHTNNRWSQFPHYSSLVYQNWCWDIFPRIRWSAGRHTQWRNSVYDYKTRTEYESRPVKMN